MCYFGPRCCAVGKRNGTLGNAAATRWLRTVEAQWRVQQMGDLTQRTQNIPSLKKQVCNINVGGEGDSCVMYRSSRRQCVRSIVSSLVQSGGDLPVNVFFCRVSFDPHEAQLPRGFPPQLCHKLIPRLRTCTSVGPGNCLGVLKKDTTPRGARWPRQAIMTAWCLFFSTKSFPMRAPPEHVFFVFRFFTTKKTHR